MSVDPGDGDWTLRGMYFGGADVAFTFLCSAAFLTARPFLVKNYFRPFGLRMKKLDPTEPPPEKSEKELQKFCKYCWHTCCYLIFWTWALCLYFPHPWAFHIDAVWQSYPHAPEGKLMFKTLFLLEAGWYLHGIVESYYYDSKRSDFLMIMIHHILAVALLWGCLWANAHRAGITVVVAQDISDIVVYISKIIHQCVAVPFLQKKPLHTFLLTCITVSWFSTRVYVLGLLVYRGWAYGFDLVPDVDPEVVFNSGALIYGHKNFDLVSVWLAVELQALHLLQIVWFLGIFRMFLSQVFSGSFHDMWHDSDLKNSFRKEVRSRSPSPPNRSGSRRGSKKVE